VKVGFIGLGNMGEGMAWNLVSKGFVVAVRDVRPDPVARLVEAGARACATNAEVGDACDVVCVAVFDADQVFETVLPRPGDPGLLAGMRPGGVLVLHPTISPTAVQRVADAAQERGVAVLDAPMTGGANVAARAGSLTFMVGGDAAVLELVRPVLAAMATSIFHVGPLGAGCAVKIINNFHAVSHVMLVRESLRLGRAAGLDEACLLNILNTGGVGSNWASSNWERIKAQEAGYTTGRAGMVAMSAKDMQLAGKMAQELGVATPALNALVEYGLPDLARTGLTDNGL
jgi:3-hydroxyisobutyrate dehydrogenase-like beta-hydroxyacid dehydrogenase